MIREECYKLVQTGGVLKDGVYRSLIAPLELCQYYWMDEWNRPTPNREGSGLFCFTNYDDAVDWYSLTCRGKNPWFHDVVLLECEIEEHRYQDRVASMPPTNYQRGDDRTPLQRVMDWWAHEHPHSYVGGWNCPRGTVIAAAVRPVQEMCVWRRSGEAI